MRRWIEELGPEDKNAPGVKVEVVLVPENQPIKVLPHER